MKLTAFTDYSLRVLIYLATSPTQGGTIAEIANAFAVSENHLMKVVHFLGRQGWLRTTRGKGGGLRLARDPVDIVIGDVIRQTEGGAVPAECFRGDGGQCNISGRCQLQGVLGRAVEAFYAELSRHTLADLTRHPQQLAQVLFFPQAATPAAGKA